MHREGGGKSWKELGKQKGLILLTPPTYPHSHYSDSKVDQWPNLDFYCGSMVQVLFQPRLRNDKAHQSFLDAVFSNNKALTVIILNNACSACPLLASSHIIGSQHQFIPCFLSLSTVWLELNNHIFKPYPSGAFTLFQGVPGRSLINCFAP